MASRSRSSDSPRVLVPSFISGFTNMMPSSFGSMRCVPTHHSDTHTGPGGIMAMGCN